MKISAAARLLLLALPVVAVPGPVAAFGFGNMMNPNKWFGGDRDRDDDYYYDDYYGPAGGYGYPGGGYPGGGYYGAPAYGAPGYAAPAYGAPGYAAPGYAAPGYAAPGGYASPAYTAPAATAPAPAPAGKSSAAVIDSDTAEIERLKARVRELEGNQSGASDVWQAPAVQGNYPAPDAWNSGSTGSGDSINTWQTPMQQSGQGNAGDAPHPSDWRPSYSTLPGSNSGGSNTTGGADRGAAAYRPPTQYPGQQMYDLGH